jgi:hypothetical protein
MNNATAIEKFATASIGGSNAIAYNLVNLRPFKATVASAVTLVGMILLCIFSFILVSALWLILSKFLFPS